MLLSPLFLRRVLNGLGRETGERAEERRERKGGRDTELKGDLRYDRLLSEHNVKTVL